MLHGQLDCAINTQQPPRSCFNHFKCDLPAVLNPVLSKSRWKCVAGMHSYSCRKRRIHPIFSLGWRPSCWPFSFPFPAYFVPFELALLRALLAARAAAFLVQAVLARADTQRLGALGWVIFPVAARISRRRLGMTRSWLGRARTPEQARDLSLSRNQTRRCSENPAQGSGVVGKWRDCRITFRTPARTDSGQLVFGKSRVLRHPSALSDIAAQCPVAHRPSCARPAHGLVIPREASSRPDALVSTSCRAAPGPGPST